MCLFYWQRFIYDPCVLSAIYGSPIVLCDTCIYGRISIRNPKGEFPTPLLGTLC